MLLFVEVYVVKEIFVNWVEKQRLEEVEDLVRFFWTIYDKEGKGWAVVLPQTTYSQLKARIEKLDII